MVVTGLKPSTIYVFHVRARTTAGYTAYSPTFEFVTAAEGTRAPELGQINVPRVLGRAGVDAESARSVEERSLLWSLLS